MKKLIAIVMLAGVIGSPAFAAHPNDYLRSADDIENQEGLDNFQAVTEENQRAVSDSEELSSESSSTINRDTYHSSKDKNCQMVNGKLECTTTTYKHKASDVGEDIEDHVEDTE